MKKIVFILVCFLMALPMMAQDIIIFTNGTEVEAKVTEVSDSEVKYKTFNNQTGPTWVKKTSEIFMIRYENGTKQTFTTEKKSQDSQPARNSEPRYSEVSPVQPVTPQLKNRSINGQTCFTIEIKEGPNYMFLEPDNNRVHSTKGIRWTPSFSGFVEYYPTSMNEKNNPFAGIGIGVQYASRGGKITKYFNPSPFTFDLRYLCIRPAFCLRDDVAFMRVAPEFSFITSAEEMCDYYEEPVDGKGETNSPILGFIYELGLYLGKYVTIGTYLEWSGIALNGDNYGLMAEKTFAEPGYTYNFTFGMSLGIVLNPLKITEYR